MNRTVVACVLLVVLCALAVPGPRAHGESSAPPEYLVKAAFLYNFAKFVDWPDEAFGDALGPLNLCILGRDPFGPFIQSIEGKTSQGRQLVVRRTDRVEDIGNCHILFVSESEKKRLAAILQTTRDRHVLTVADMEGFARRGGIVTLVKVEDRIRFEINIDAAERAGLRISAKLLNLAKIIRDGDG